MSSTVRIPLILQKDKAKELNAKVYFFTGCIFFIKIPEEDFLFTPRPTTEKERYYNFSLNLYKLYHDFGDRFLRICTSLAQLPQVLDDENTFTLQDVNQLRRDREAVVKHITGIISAIRTLSAHGIYTGYKGYQDPSEKVAYNWMRHIIGRDWPTTDNEWKMVADAICDEADFAFHWLEKWADIWSHSSTGINLMRDRFFYGHWTKPLYESTLQEVQNQLDMTPDNIGAIYTQNGKFTTFAKFFNPQFIQNGIRSGYFIASCGNNGHTKKPNKYGKIWRASDPEKNLDILVGEINLPAVEAVRKELLSGVYRQKLGYVDFYQIYLEKLSDEMVGLQPGKQKHRHGKLGPRR